MDQASVFLHQTFGQFPQPVFFLQNSQIQYRNQEALLQFPADPFSPDFLQQLPAEPATLRCSLPRGVFQLVITPISGGLLLLLQPDTQSPQAPSAAVSHQLRSHLSQLTAATERLESLLRQSQGSDWQQLLAIQNQTIYRLLRLVRQLELSRDDWQHNHPKTPMDLASVLHGIVDELTYYIGSAPKISFTAAAEGLSFYGSRSLLEQLLLTLVSNSLHAVEPDGHIGIRLEKKQSRVVLTLWDSGPGISEETLLRLFSPSQSEKLPRPNDGSGLDLWLAHRIVTYHEGSIMAGNRPEGGASFTVSLPISPPALLQMRGDAHHPNDGFSPVLVALSVNLPASAFLDVLEP